MMTFTGDYICTSYKRELLLAGHDFTVSDQVAFKIALFSNSASLVASTTDYSTSGEVTGTGYSAGGIALVTIEPAEDGTTGYTSFANAVFSAVTLTARGALIYNTTYKGGSGTTNAVAVLDFGSDKSPVGQNLTITFPVADGNTAIIRIT